MSKLFYSSSYTFSIIKFDKADNFESINEIAVAYILPLNGINPILFNF